MNFKARCAWTWKLRANESEKRVPDCFFRALEEARERGGERGTERERKRGEKERR